MPNNDLPVTVDEIQNPAGASDAPHSTTTPETEASIQATPALDLRSYELSERLGGGGMGDVYRSGDPALGRDLAVKVMKAEMQGYAAAEQRFLREARVTGSLQHPGIVPIYNLGRLSDGRLHYTMRLVRGRTFADILKEEAGQAERLPALLAIFEKICQAVAYAHSKRVLHRDLKPSNIMVGRFGEVQVMDWGLAKILTAKDDPQTVESEIEGKDTNIHTEDADTPPELTRLGRGMGTPAYMPPEQALGEWDSVDERADVFALGSILCEILTGRPPYSGSGALQKAKQGDLAEALTRLEGCAADALLVELCRECLSPAREGRPRDAEQAAQRIAAYQAQVQERLRRAELERTAALVQARWERKRRLWMLVGALLLLAGTAVSTGLAVWAKKEEGRALTAMDAERLAKDLAQTRLEQIEKSNEVSISIFRDLDPRAEEKGGPKLRLQLSQHLQRAARQLDEGAVGDPLAVARLQAELGRSLIGLGQIKLAIELLSKAGMVMEHQLGADHPNTLASRIDLGTAYVYAGRVTEAIRQYEQTLRQLEAKLGADHADALNARNSLASAYWSAGRIADAIRLQEQTLMQREAKLGADHPDTLVSLNNLAEMYRETGRSAEAIHMHEQILKRLEAKVGADHPSALTSRNNLAEAYLDADRTADAVRMHEQTLRRLEASFGADHPNTLASRNNLASAYQFAGRTAEAIRLHEQNLKQMESKIGLDHPDTLSARNNLAEAYRTVGRTAEAIHLHEQNLKQRETERGVDHPDTLTSRNGLATAYLHTGCTAEAIQLYELNLKHMKAKLGADHPHTLRSMANLGTAYREVGRRKDAIQLLETTLERIGKRPGGLPALMAEVSGSLAETYERDGQFAKAESLYRDALERAQRKFGPDDPHTAVVVAQLGDNLLKQKKFGDAEALLRHSLKVREAKQSDEWAIFNTRSALGEALLGQMKYTEAEPLLLQGYQGMKQRQDKISPAFRLRHLSEALERLVRLYETTGQKDKANDWRKTLEEAKAASKKS